MNSPELTKAARLATYPSMQGNFMKWLRSGRRAVRAVMVVLAVPTALSGCINVSAPDKPIVIELNINIRQEVIYRLAADAANTIEENKDIF